MSAAGNNAHDVAISADDRYVWVVAQRSGVFIFDAEQDMKLVKEIDLPEPNHVAFSPTGEEVFITDLTEGGIIVFDANTFEIIKNVETGNNPHEIVFLEKQSSR